MKCFFKREWTLEEKILSTGMMFFFGMVLGFLLAPIKKGIECGCNNGNNYGTDWEE